MVQTFYVHCTWHAPSWRGLLELGALIAAINNAPGDLVASRGRHSRTGSRVVVVSHELVTAGVAAADAADYFLRPAGGSRTKLARFAESGNAVAMSSTAETAIDQGLPACTSKCEENVLTGSSFRQNVFYALIYAHGKRLAARSPRTSKYGRGIVGLNEQYDLVLVVFPTDDTADDALATTGGRIRKKLVFLAKIDNAEATSSTVETAGDQGLAVCIGQCKKNANDGFARAIFSRRPTHTPSPWQPATLTVGPTAAVLLVLTNNTSLCLMLLMMPFLPTAGNSRIKLATFAKSDKAIDASTTAKTTTRKELTVCTGQCRNNALETRFRTGQYTRRAPYLPQAPLLSKYHGVVCLS